MPVVVVTFIQPSQPSDELSHVGQRQFLKNALVCYVCVITLTCKISPIKHTGLDCGMLFESVEKLY